MAKSEQKPTYLTEALIFEDWKIRHSQTLEANFKINCFYLLGLNYFREKGEREVGKLKTSTYTKLKR